MSIFLIPCVGLEISLQHHQSLDSGINLLADVQVKYELLRKRSRGVSSLSTNSSEWDVH